MKTFQHTIKLKEKKRGFHLITDEVVHSAPEINEIKMGICHVFIQHTSASLTLNEDASPDVRKDFDRLFNKDVAENDRGYLHDDEGPDDMPAHLNASVWGSSEAVPVLNGIVACGMWQGIDVLKMRNAVHGANPVVTSQSI